MNRGFAPPPDTARIPAAMTGGHDNGRTEIRASRLRLLLEQFQMILRQQALAMDRIARNDMRSDEVTREAGNLG